jgi:hypothetical protein
MIILQKKTLDVPKDVVSVSGPLQRALLSDFLMSSITGIDPALAAAVCW